MRSSEVVVLVALISCIVAIPLSMTTGVNDVTLRVFSNGEANELDVSKHYVIYLYDQAACDGAKSDKCHELEGAVAEAAHETSLKNEFANVREKLIFGKVNKDDFPSHKKEFEKAKLSLPTILFWPAGHLRPTCKLEATHPSKDSIASWLAAKLTDEDPAIMMVATQPATATPDLEKTSEVKVASSSSADTQGPAPTVETGATKAEAAPATDAAVKAEATKTETVPATVTQAEAAPVAVTGAEAAPATTDKADTAATPAAVDPSTMVCKVGEQAVVSATGDVTCGDLSEASTESKAATTQGLMQLERTQQLWDFKTAQEKFVGPADNALAHTLTDARPAPDVESIDSQKFLANAKKGYWQALYFNAPWCKYCGCLGPVWQTVANNLVGSRRQPELVVASVNGDENADLRGLFNVTVYPTFVLVNKDGTKVLGRYLGPRKAFELSNWIEDLIVADQAPIVKHQFDVTEQGPLSDLHPVYPFSGPAAFPPAPPAQMLVSTETALTGNYVDECDDADESKYTGMNAGVFVQSEGHALDWDASAVSPSKVPSQIVIVDFFAPWCPHCQHLAPVWDNVHDHFKENNNVMIGKVDVEAHPDVKNAFGIHRFPTIMYFEAGKPMQPDEGRRYKGARDEQHLEEWIAQLANQKA